MSWLPADSRNPCGSTFPQERRPAIPQPVRVHPQKFELQYSAERFTVTETLLQEKSSYDIARRGKLTPLFPANVLRDVISPGLKKAKIEWLGYHAFRRGLATNCRGEG